MPISISDTIDIQYRLQPQDLGGRARRVLVRNVTLQGVEGLTPLVHFEGMARPLALDLEQRIQIANIAQSALLVDWIGLTLVLAPVRDGGFDTIRLLAVNDRSAKSNLPADSWVRRRPPGVIILRLVLITILILLVAATVIWVENVPSLADWRTLVPFLSR